MLESEEVCVLELVRFEHKVTIVKFEKGVKISGFDSKDRVRVQKMFPNAIAHFEGNCFGGFKGSTFSFIVEGKDLEWVKRQLTSNLFLRTFFEILYFFGVR